MRLRVENDSILTIVLPRRCDIDNGKQHKYVCTTTNQPETKSNPSPCANPNPLLSSTQ